MTMGFIQTLTEFFESIFKSSSPEVRKRQELRKMEAELRARQPQIFKNELLLPNFAELFRILYENTKPLADILGVTISGSDVQMNGRFEAQLILTGFDDATQKKLEKLNYEGRKKGVQESNLTMNQQFELQRRSFQEIMRQVEQRPEFRKIDETMARLQQLSDVCRFNYLNVIHAFDPGYAGVSTSLGAAKAVPPEIVSAFLQDLYYITANLSLQTSVVRAVVALRQLKGGRELTQEESDSLAGNIRKISTILTRTLDPETLRKIICLAKRDPSFKPKIATYQGGAVKRFVDYLQGRFEADETRIKTEIKDYTISFELRELFGEAPLLELKTYNSAMNDRIRNCSPFSFEWITPMQTMKTFLNMYFSEAVRTVLNNIVIEGFFSNPAYKTDFASMVYACNEIPNRMEAFEKSFDRGERNDEVNLASIIDDCSNDPSFQKLLENSVNSINAQAYSIIQEESKNLFRLYKQIGELIVDAKKSKSDLISNIKVLMSSTRNRDGSGILEQQHGSWKVFLKIMKNYAILGELDDDAK